MAEWYEIQNADDVASPALLLYPDRIESNIRRMLDLTGGPARVRPHVKTHKLPQIVRMQLAAGIDKFKCATLAEAEMVAECGATDVLLAYQPVGPNVQRLAQLAQRFTGTTFSALVDDASIVEQLEDASARIGLLLDIDCGMQRSGMPPDAAAEHLYRRIAASTVVWPAGLHVYDGQIKQGSVESRREAVAQAFAPVEQLRTRLLNAGLAVPQVVAGGSPTFWFHAEHADRQCSPGTTLLWDGSYMTKFPEMEFANAAMVLTRVISKPAADVLCLDLGYKAVSPDNPNPRALFPQLPDAVMTVHSEEHMAVQSASANHFALGDCLYAIPWHVCPTVALYSEAIVVENSVATERWKIVARERKLTI